MAGPLGSRLTEARSLKGKLTSAAAAGARVTVLADLFARAALPGIQLPVGVMTGLIRAPYLLWLLSREMERGRIMTPRAENLSLGYHDHIAINDLAIELKRGDMTTILSPNGCGKIGCPEIAGTVGEAVEWARHIEWSRHPRLNSRSLAREMAILPQTPLALDCINAGDLVKWGRTPWRGFLSPWSEHDSQASKMRWMPWD